MINTKTIFKISLLASLVALLLTSFVLAQDEGLYPDPPPADAAFVRVVNAFQGDEASQVALQVKVADRDYAELAFAEASDYYVVLQGEHEIVVGETSITAEILAGRFYTVVLSELKAVIEEATGEETTGEEVTGEGATEASAESEDTDSESTTTVMVEEDTLNISLVEDPSNSNRAKTLLTLYNLSSSEAIDLKTADASVDVILGVSPLSVGNIPVNPIAVDLASFSGEEQISEYAGLRLERGGIYSAIVMDGSDSLTSIWVLTKTVLDDE